LVPNFPNGLLVLQDGANDPQNPVQTMSNWKTTAPTSSLSPGRVWPELFDNSLLVDPSSYDPRNPQPQSLVNGVASGDVTQDSVVLWARSTFLGDVAFEYSTSEDFSDISGTTMATVTDITQPVKVAIEGLTPAPNTSTG
jgi:alkaline phosphatase D